jgi:stage II sporulation protein D
MKNKILLIICLLLVFIYIMSFPKKETHFSLSPESTVKVNLKMKDNSIINISLEDYVIGVVAAEMPAEYPIEALKAQAIASRTYAMYKINTSQEKYDVTTDVTTQAYYTQTEMQERWQSKYEYYYNKIKEAVNSTKNIVMKQNEEPICAYYFAISNGYTESSISVFGGDLSYAESVPSIWDENSSGYEKTISIDKNTFCNKLNIKCNNIIIKDVNKDSTGRVDSININSQTFKGTDVRKLLNLRSTDFAINSTDKDNIIITTKGYGHGVGMSQYGAYVLAKNGKNYNEILNYYYHNIEIKEI